MTTVSNRAYTHDLRERLRSWQGSPTCPITILARAKSPTPAQVSAALANLRELKPATPADQKHLRETIEMVKKLAPMPMEQTYEYEEEWRRGNPIAPGEEASHPVAPSVVTKPVPVSALGNLETRVRKLVKKAEKLGLPPLRMEVGERHIVYRMDEGRRVPIEVADVTIRGDSPRLPGGWRFVATIDHAGGDGMNIIRAVPGESVPAALRTSAAGCQHCRLQRDRRETFLVKNDAGKEVQVGRSCLVDFMGHQSAEQIADLAAMYADLFTEMDEGFGGGGGGEYLVTREIYLAFVVQAIRESGWMSKKMADEDYDRDKPKVATSTYAWNMATRRDGKYAPPSEESIAKAEEVIRWVNTIPKDTPSDYLYNLKATLAKEAFRNRDVGIAASAVAAYDRERGELKKREDERAGRAASSHFGTIGERERERLTVEKVIALDGDYGVSYIHLMRTPEGNIAKWKTGTQRLDEGKEYDFVCTIDAHDDYKGTKQTVLKRCKAYEAPVAKVPKTRKPKKVEEKKEETKPRDRDDDYDPHGPDGFPMPREPNPAERSDRFNHLASLEEGLSRERARLAGAKSERERKHRQVLVRQREKEIAGEKAFLGVTDTSDVNTDDLLSELMEESPSIEQTQRKILEHDMDERRHNPATISGKIPSQLRQPLVSA